MEDLGNKMVVGPPREVIKKTRPSLVQQALVHAVNSRRQVRKQPGYGDPIRKGTKNYHISTLW